MKPRPIRMPDSLWDELAAEAEEEGLSTAEYIRRILRNRQADTQADTQPDTSSLAERVAELEAAVFDASDAPAAESRTRDRDTPTPQTAETTLQNDEVPDGTGDDFLDDYREFLEEQGQQKRVVREQLVTMLEALRQRGPLETSDLKDVLEENVGDRYQSRKTMWESYHRHVKRLPGFEKAGYGEWDFAGEEETRKEF